MHGCGKMMRAGAPSPRAPNVGVLRQMHDHRGRDARGDAIDQCSQIVIVGTLASRSRWLLHDDFGAAGGQPDQIEAETGDRADRLKR